MATYTLNADSGTFALTGTAASLRWGRKLSASAGTFVFTGTAATLRYGRAVAAGSGTFTLAGTAASLKYARVLMALGGDGIYYNSLSALQYNGLAAGIYNPLVSSGFPTYAAVNSRDGTISGGGIAPGSGQGGGSFLLRGGSVGLYLTSVGPSGTTADGDYYVGSQYGIGGLLMVTVDLVKGGAGSRHIIQGWGITRTAVVSGLSITESGGVTTAMLLNTALAALIAVVGDRGTPCPDIAEPTYLEQFVIESVSTDTVTFKIIYKGYPTPTFEFAGSLAQVESNLDAQGNLITTQYTYPTDYSTRTGGDPRRNGKTVIQGGMITRPTPEPIFVMKFTVTAGNINGIPATATQLVTWLKQTLEGFTNTNFYQIGNLLGAPAQWLIDSVSGVSRDGGFSYEASITFHFRAATWNPLVVFINPDDGKPPPDLIQGVGYKQVSGPPTVFFPTFEFFPN